MEASQQIARRKGEEEMAQKHCKMRILCLHGFGQSAAWLEEQDQGGVQGYDGRFYAERLAAALGRITEAFGWTAQDLMRGSRQTSLFSF